MHLTNWLTDIYSFRVDQLLKTFCISFYVHKYITMYNGVNVWKSRSHHAWKKKSCISLMYIYDDACPSVRTHQLHTIVSPIQQPRSFKNANFFPPIWLRNRLISAGLEPVLSHTKKICKAAYYRQFSMNIKKSYYYQYTVKFPCKCKRKNIIIYRIVS